MRGQRDRFEVRGPAAVRGARDRVRLLLGAWGVGGALADDLVVCLSEAVTNGIVHAAGGAVSIRVARTAAGVRVEVVDAAARLPVLHVPVEALGEAPDADGLDEHGRGLFLLDALASRWGVAPVPPAGKRLWFELDVPVPVPVGAAR